MQTQWTASHLWLPHFFLSGVWNSWVSLPLAADWCTHLLAGFGLAHSSGSVQSKPVLGSEGRLLLLLTLYLFVCFFQRCLLLCLPRDEVLLFGTSLFYPTYIKLFLIKEQKMEFIFHRLKWIFDNTFDFLFGHWTISNVHNIDER